MEGQETNNNETTNQINNETEKKENSVQATNKPKIVPAYMKMKEENSDNANTPNTPNSKKIKGKPNKAKTNKPHKKINKKLIITLVITVVLLVALSIFIYVIAQNKKYAKYLPYEETMHTYAFDIMYDNQTAATREKVTKSEAIKMAIAATLNIEEVPGMEDNGTFNNNIWVRYAVTKGIIGGDEVNESNADDLVTYTEFITYLEKAKVKLLKQDLKTSVELQYKDKDKYTTEEQTYLQDLIESGVIENSKSKLKGNRKVFKGEVNELVTKYAEKNNTITLEGDKININPDKVPSNADMYPFTLSNVDKKVYEKDFYKVEGMEEDFRSPKDMYIERKTQYEGIKEGLEEYFSYILNIDYNTISADTLEANLNNYTSFEVDSSDVEEYVEYVKNNNIKISGNAKVQMPIVYYDGTYYRVRIKLEFKVESAIQNENLIFGDLFQEEAVKYENDNTIIIDEKLSPLILSNGLVIYKTLPLEELKVK